VKAVAAAKEEAANVVALTVTVIAAAVDIVAALVDTVMAEVVMAVVSEISQANAVRIAEAAHQVHVVKAVATDADAARNTIYKKSS
jgi:hypothetical protein